MSGAGAPGSSGTATAPELRERVQQDRRDRPSAPDEGHPVAARATPAPATRRAMERASLSSCANVSERSAGDQRGPLGQRLGGAREPVVNSHVAWWVGICERLSCDPAWTTAGLPQASYTDIRYEKGAEDATGIAKITIARPEVRNAFRPETLIEISAALEDAREDTAVGVIVLTGEGPDAFCSGGDQRVRGDSGYVAGGASSRQVPCDRPACADAPPAEADRRDGGRLCRRRGTRAARGLRPHDRRRQRPLRADRAARRQLRRRLWRGLLASQVGQKKAKEIWFLCRQYSAQEALDMGLVNTVVPLEELEDETVRWCREMLQPVAVRAAAAEGELQRGRGWHGRACSSLRTTPTCSSTCARRRQEGRDAYREKRDPDFSQVPPPAVVLAARHGPAAHLGDGRASTHAPGRDRPGARRHRAGRREGEFHPLAFCAALLGSVFIQIGTNLSNDYSDARRGADTEERLGPVRVTAGGLVPPRKVLVATWLAFGIAVAAGAYLIAMVGWELLAIGAASILAGRPLHRRPAPVRIRGAGRGVRLHVLRPGRRGGLLLRADRGADGAGVRPGRAGGPAVRRDPDGQQHPRHRHGPPRAASARWRCGWGAAGRSRCSRPRCGWRSAGPSASRSPRRAVAGAAAARRCRWSRRWQRTVATRTDGPALNGALARTGHAPGRFSLLLSAGLLLAY